MVNLIRRANRRVKTMKGPLWFFSALVLCLMLNGCSAKDRDKEETGGIRDWTNLDASKSIQSEEIIAFKYEFNSSFSWYYDRQTAYDYCSLSMMRQEDGALCRIWGLRDGYYRLFDFEFTAPLSSLNALQALIDEHDLAKVNGISKTTYGIPEYLGSSLRVEYASGERIYAYDNNDDVISIQATLALFDFFRNLARDAGRDFLHTEEEIQNFQTHIAGLWKDMDSTVMLVIYGNVIKIYEGQTLLEDTTYFREYEKLYNERGKSVYFGRYVLFEWRDGSIVGIEENGAETEFYWHGEYEEEHNSIEATP